jgi:hypothetical protein
MINLAGMLYILLFRFLGNLPNTYTFSKSLAEHVVKDLGEDFPVVIFRPSVGECLREMLPFCLCSAC